MKYERYFDNAQFIKKVDMDSEVDINVYISSSNSVNSKRPLFLIRKNDNNTFNFMLDSNFYDSCIESAKDEEELDKGLNKIFLLFRRYNRNLNLIKTIAILTILVIGSLWAFGYAPFTLFISVEVILIIIFRNFARKYFPFFVDKYMKKNF
ncbi:hypothetical protein RJG79_04550 [Mycoplasmatota bacterium WC44]